jgi:cysteine desulfurase
MRSPSSLFLDANAHLPLNEKAAQAFVEFNRTLGGHGHAQSPSVPGRAAASAIENARARIANAIGARSPNQIVFTSTCTQACEWAVHILSKLPGIKQIYVSPLEHPAVRYKCREVLNAHKLNVDEEGVVVCKTELPEASGVVCIHVQNEIGVIQPVEQIRAKAIVSDMSQTLGKLSINMSSFPNVSIAIFGAHKFGGPVGVGFFYLQDETLYREFGSGSRYYMDRTGTPDAAAVVATAVALEEALNSLPQRYENMIAFRDVLEPGLEELGMNIISKNAARIPGTTFARVPKSRALQLMTQLAESGIYVGLGSACGSLQTGPSPLMAELNLGGNTTDYIRISQFGHYTAEDAKRLLAKMSVLFPKKSEIP